MNAVGTGLLAWFSLFACAQPREEPNRVPHPKQNLPAKHATKFEVSGDTYICSLVGVTEAVWGRPSYEEARNGLTIALSQKIESSFRNAGLLREGTQANNLALITRHQIVADPHRRGGPCSAPKAIFVSVQYDLNNEGKRILAHIKIEQSKELFEISVFRDTSEEQAERQQRTISINNVTNQDIWEETARQATLISERLIGPLGESAKLPTSNQYNIQLLAGLCESTGCGLYD